MNRKVTLVIRYILLLVIAFSLLILAFKGISLNKVWHEIIQAKFLWVLFSAVLSIIALISRAFRWNLLIESSGYSPALPKTFYALMIGYFANLALPRLGEVTRCGGLSKTEKIPFTNLLGTVIAERVVDVISLFICIILAAILEYRRLGNFLRDNIIQPVIDKCKHLISSPISVVAAIVLLTGLIFLIVLYIKKIRQKGKDSKWFKLLKDFIDGLRSIVKLKKPWLFIFHSVFIWVLYFFATYVCFFALPSTSNLGLSASLLLLVAGGIAMSAPVQGGIGAYHLLVSQGLILYGISQQDGITFATLIHALQLMLIVVLGSISMILLFSGKRKILKQ